MTSVEVSAAVILCSVQQHIGNDLCHVSVGDENDYLQTSMTDEKLPFQLFLSEAVMIPKDVTARYVTIPACKIFIMVSWRVPPCHVLFR